MTPTTVHTDTAIAPILLALQRRTRVIGSSPIVSAVW